MNTKLIFISCMADTEQKVKKNMLIVTDHSKVQMPLTFMWSPAVTNHPNIFSNCMAASGHQSLTHSTWWVQPTCFVNMKSWARKKGFKGIYNSCPFEA